MDREIPPAQPPPAELPHVLLWRWRRNPLRRRTDLVQAWIALGLFLAVLAATPAAMILVGDTAYRHYRETARQQTATREYIPAVLVHDAPRHPEPGSDEAKKTRYPVTVRFTDSQGHTRTAQADVEPALTAGSTVRVWVDGEGRITGPPLTAEQVRTRAMSCAVLTAMTVPLLGAAAYAYANRRLERHNFAQWDAAWAQTAPPWTTSH
ncbi:hypothetical protein KUF83_21665 [Streptomyces sp. BV286]|uniref:Rv1733c family protein n=1 Tax=Streptomyces sp. BV286 TaxID=2849672 RepID=UPI001C2E316C|nr:hypothetical protein [Streptomyces sp. BV286]MBV1939145.1 hypothetical protein [Streptomyces sp. BV286]